MDSRLRQADCRINGWVLDGFPSNEIEINLLKSMGKTPTTVILLEQSVEECVRRLGNKRVDPLTGDLYNTEINPPKDEKVASRL